MSLVTPGFDTPHRENGTRYVTTVPQAVGREIRYPPEAPRAPTAQLKDIVIDGPFRTMLKLVNCWNATVEDPFLTFALSEEENANPTQVQIGIDVGMSMDTHISRPRILNARVGIRAGDPDPNNPGRAEGLHVGEGGWIQHCMTGIELHGKMGGGRACPSHYIAPRHINFLQYGIFAFTYFGLQIRNINMYASHYRTGQWGIYLVNCNGVTIDGVDFWRNGPGFYGAIVLDQCENVFISGGTIDPTVTIALHATSSCRNVRTSGPQWEQAARDGKVVNRAQNGSPVVQRVVALVPRRRRAAREQDYAEHLPWNLAA
jgi:hypothetical protein